MPAILITGATGQQGGSVIDALLDINPNNVEIRALTRNPASAAALSLKRRGVLLMHGDLSDKASLERALEGCIAAYLATDFRGPNDVEGEVAQGKFFVDTMKQQGVTKDDSLNNTCN